MRQRLSHLRRAALSVKPQNSLEIVESPFEGLFRTETHAFKMKDAFEERLCRYAPTPYCFILRQSVTELIFSASAAWRRLPRKRLSARSIMTRSCA